MEKDWIVVIAGGSNNKLAKLNSIFRTIDQVWINQLEKLEAARSAYLCLPSLTFPYLSLPFLTFPNLSLPFHTFPYLSLLTFPWPYLALQGLTWPYWALLGLSLDLSNGRLD